LTTSLETPHERALRRHAGGRIGVVNCLQQGLRLLIVIPGDEREGPLPYRRDPACGVEVLGHPVCPPEAYHSSRGQDDAIEIPCVELTEAGVEVAAEIASVQIRPEVPELRATPERTRTDPRTGPKPTEHFGRFVRPGDQHIPRVLPS